MKFRFHVLDSGKGTHTFRKIPGGEVRVGLVGPRATALHLSSNDGSSTIEIGLYHEFGTEVLPERSFLRSTFDNHGAKYRSLQKDLASLILGRKMKVQEALAILGETVASDVLHTLTEGVEPPVSEETIRRRGPGVPLIVTKQILDAVGYQIVPEGKRASKTKYLTGG